VQVCAGTNGTDRVADPIEPFTDGSQSARNASGTESNFKHRKPIMNMRLTALSLALAAGLIGACATKEEPAAPNMLIAAKAATAPVLDGDANDAVWASAKSIKVELEDGMNFADGKGKTTATL
jgi:hypothetical protein